MIGVKPMRLSMLRSSCQNGRTCPNINTTDRSTVVVQGYTTRQARPDRVTTVAIPRSLVPELAESHPGFALVGAETVHVTGRRVSDPEALTELALPPGEDAVELPITQLPEGVLISC